VVGVSGEVKIGGVDDGLGPFVLFQPTSIDRLAGVQLAIRTTDNTAGLSARVRETIRALVPACR
jgi:siroheme synthase (precorrin-2 oxidase/ferrochelatase)